MPLVHRLVYTWDGWPSGDSPLPREPDLSPVDALWLKEGLRRLGTRWRQNLIQMSFETSPVVSPVLFASRVKGRLDHLLRSLGTPVRFSRKVGVRAIGDNTDPVVERYLALQQRRGDFADPRYRATLAEFSGEFPDVDLDAPSETGSGRYWYNLHIVAVTNDRSRMGREDYLPRLSKAIPEWSQEERAPLRSFSFMADHVHLALRGDPSRSPAEIAESLYRRINRAAGLRLFSDRIYVGSFSSYSKREIGLAPGSPRSR
jgi:hypothetical protein